MPKTSRTSILLLVVLNAAVLLAVAGSGCGDKDGGSSDGKEAAKYMGGAPPGVDKPGAPSSGAATKTPPGPSPGGAPR